MGFNFTDPKSWKKTFDPAENGVNDSFKTVETSLNPDKNGVSDAFKEQFSDEVWNPEKNGVFSFLNSFSDSIGGLFSDAAGGFQDGLQDGAEGITTMLLIGGGILLVVTLMDN
jgi:hypothetical protein